MRISTALEARDMLRSLVDRGLQPNTVRKYYGDLKRAAISEGIDVSDWPKLKGEGRKRHRDPISAKDCKRIDTWLRDHGADDTADLAHLIRHTGMRPQVEAISSDLRAKAECHYTALTIENGKGGHERTIPVVDLKTRHMLADGREIQRIRQTPYRTHAHRLKTCVEELGITSRMPTLHAFRHTYATEAYNKTKDREMVQHLLGHASGDTTSKYIGTKDLGEIANGLLTE